MKQINAYIQPFMLEKVTEALRVMQVNGVTVLPCQGVGRLSTDTESPHYLEEGAPFGLAAKVKIEVVCDDANAHKVVATIQKSAHTGHHGDGKIFVTDVLAAVDIRTGATEWEVV